MFIAPDVLTVILGLTTNGLTSLLSVSSQRIGKLIVGKEFIGKWELEKTSLLPVLNTAISELAEHIELEETKGEEIICLFLLSPEVEDIVRQIYSLQIARNDGKQDNLLSLHKIFLTLFTQFIASYPSELVPEQVSIEKISNLLIKMLIQSCDLALSIAIDRGILAAHEAKSNLRHNIIYGELGAIQKKLDLFTSQPLLDVHAILEFEKKYRQQIIERHGYITPPDFDTAHQIPIDELYVCPSFSIIPPIEETQKVMPLDTFLSRAYRAVLLGNPGAGKSTLTAKLCHDIATNHSQRLFAGRYELTPILVVLRNYGVEKKEHRCSILEFIKTEVEGTYQLLTPPAGTFEYLLLNGRAAVIFDGLDELLDTSFRQEIRDDVQSFCNLYPSVPVLVTSREIGYEQAPLSEQLFEVFRLEAFNTDQVKEYAQKWFRLADNKLVPRRRQQKIESFLKESESVSDLRSNALMLALMCNIYKGENYIPKNRPDVYEKCANMLFERWDRSRNIRFTLPFEAHVRPAMMYIAYWIYTNIELRAGVTERMLIAKASEYLLQKRFEDSDEAEKAAQEFIRFCRGRAWVFTDTGTEKGGERLYQFTHQTFLEFFTAAYLVRIHPTPETLMTVLEPRISKREWDVVAQLAFQIQNKSSENAGDALLLLLLDYAGKAQKEQRYNILSFAGRCLKFIVPSPKVTRKITNDCFKSLVVYGCSILHHEHNDISLDQIQILSDLLSATIENCGVIAGELEKSFIAIINNGNESEAQVALDMSHSLTHTPYFDSDNNFSWNNSYANIMKNTSKRLEVIYPSSLYNCYGAVWGGYTKIQNMIRWFGLGSLFDVSDAQSIFGASGYATSMAEILIHRVLYTPQKLTSWHQECLSLLENLGECFYFNTLFVTKKSYSLERDALKNIIELRHLRKSEVMHPLEPNVLFALFILFAILLELCDKYKLQFGLESIKSKRHPFFALIYWIFIAHFEQVEIDIIQEEMTKCNFTQEQQRLIWKWVRNELNFLEYEKIEVSFKTGEESKSMNAKRKRR